MLLCISSQPVMAHLSRPPMSALLPLPGGIRTLSRYRRRTGFDPKATFGGCSPAPHTERAAAVAREATDVAACDRASSIMVP